MGRSHVREEREAFPLLRDQVDPAGEAAIREALAAIGGSTSRASRSRSRDGVADVRSYWSGPEHGVSSIERTKARTVSGRPTRAKSKEPVAARPVKRERSDGSSGVRNEQDAANARNMKNEREERERLRTSREGRTTRGGLDSTWAASSTVKAKKRGEQRQCFREG